MVRRRLPKVTERSASHVLAVTPDGSGQQSTNYSAKLASVPNPDLRRRITTTLSTPKSLVFNRHPRPHRLRITVRALPSKMLAPTTWSTPSGGRRRNNVRLTLYRLGYSRSVQPSCLHISPICSICRTVVEISLRPINTPLSRHYSKKQVWTTHVCLVIDRSQTCRMSQRSWRGLSTAS